LFVSSRYENRETIFRSNKSFSKWEGVLGDQVMVSLVLDKILNHSSVVNIRGESYGLKDWMRNSLPRFRGGEKG